MTKHTSQFNQPISAKIIKQAQDGQIKAQENIYRTFADAVYHLALSITHEKHASEDIVQNTFISVLKRVTTFKFRAPFGMWLRKIAVNQTLMYIRVKNNKNNKHTELLENIIDINDHINQQQTLQNDELKQSDAHIDLYMLLSQLPLQTRTILWLKEVEGYTHKEIATMLNKTESYSKAVVARSYQFLRKKYPHQPEIQSQSL